MTETTAGSGTPTPKRSGRRSGAARADTDDAGKQPPAQRATRRRRAAGAEAEPSTPARSRRRATASTTATPGGAAGAPEAAETSAGNRKARTPRARTGRTAPSAAAEAAERAPAQASGAGEAVPRTRRRRATTEAAAATTRTRARRRPATETATAGTAATARTAATQAAGTAETAAAATPEAATGTAPDRGTQAHTPEPATPEPSTPEPATPEPTTPEPPTPQPSTPEGSDVDAAAQISADETPAEAQPGAQPGARAGTAVTDAATAGAADSTGSGAAAAAPDAATIEGRRAAEASVKPAKAAKPGATFTIVMDMDSIVAGVVAPDGKAIGAGVEAPSCFPCEPEALVDETRRAAAAVPAFERVSVGFPGPVRDGHVLSVPGFVSGGKGKLRAAWAGFDLGGALRIALGKPVRVANAITLASAGVIEGSGLELVVMLDDGFETSVFVDGAPAIDLNLAAHEFRKGATYAEQLGEPARRRAGRKKWNRRVQLALDSLDRLLGYDRVYILGGNASRVSVDLGPKARVLADGLSPLQGGGRLWQQVASSEREAKGTG
jgi:polyphosphate glucokinase